MFLQQNKKNKKKNAANTRTVVLEYFKNIEKWIEYINPR